MALEVAREHALRERARSVGNHGVALNEKLPFLAVAPEEGRNGDRQADREAGPSPRWHYTLGLRRADRYVEASMSVLPMRGAAVALV
jgi:hypothetical protein